MSPQQLAEIGEALYGPAWRAALAQALGVSERNVRRWAAGGEIPEGVGRDLAALCRRQSDLLTKLAEQLEVMSKLTPKSL